jgi:sulfate permease, SulP family
MQLLAGFARLGKFIRLVPQPVMLGFINGLALVVAVSQLHNFKDASGGWLAGQDLVLMVALTALTMGIIAVWERIELPVTEAVPAPLISIIAVSCVTAFCNLHVTTVGSLATISGQLPTLALPQVPFTLETLNIIFPYAISVAAVGLIQALLVQQLIDDLTDARTSTHIECFGQGVAQVLSKLEFQDAVQ